MTNGEILPERRSRHYAFAFAFSRYAIGATLILLIVILHFDIDRLKVELEHEKAEIPRASGASKPVVKQTNPSLTDPSPAQRNTNSNDQQKARAARIKAQYANFVNLVQSGKDSLKLEQSATESLEQYKVKIWTRYRAFLENLRRREGPELVENVLNELANMEANNSDFSALVRNNNINLANNESRWKIIDAEEAMREEGEKSLSNILGTEHYLEYQNYKNSIPLRLSINQLGLRLSYSEAPLSDEQIEQLVGSMPKRTTVQIAPTGIPSSPSIYSVEFLAVARKLLMPPQLATFDEMIAERAEISRLELLVRQAVKK
jgi:hypothetical protein